MITALEDLGIHVLTKLANMIYDTGTFPDELSDMLIPCEHCLPELFVLWTTCGHCALFILQRIFE